MVGDDPMSAIIFWTSEKGDITKLSYVLRNPKTPDKEFKTLEFYVTRVIFLLEIHRGTEWTNKSKYQHELERISAYMTIMTEEMKGLG